MVSAVAMQAIVTMGEMGAMAEAAGAKRIGVYPGTFDPVTNGHMDIIKRACLLADRLIIAVSTNAGKGPLLTINERMSLMKSEIADPRNGLDPNKVEVRAFDNLLMHFVEQMGAHFRPLFQQADREIRGLLLQCDGGTEASRAATDDDDIKFHCFAFHLASVLDLA